MGKLCKILVIFGIITFTANFILQPLSSPYTLTAAIDINSTADQDWPTVQLSSNLNVSWEAIKTIPDNNGLIYVLWNEFNLTTNETYLYFCFYDGITFSEPELILHFQENVTIGKLRIPFDAVFDSLNRLHIVYLLKMNDYQFYHQYYSTEVWSTPVPLDYWGQFTLLADSQANVYLFGVIRYPENAPNIFMRTFSEDSWSAVEQLTMNIDQPTIAQSIYDLTPAVDKEAKRIFIGYNYGEREFLEEYSIESWQFHYLIKEGSTWLEKTYRDDYCYEPKAVIDGTGRIHFFYNNGTSVDGYFVNHAVLKNFWGDEENIQIFTNDDPEARYEPHIHDIKILGSDIFIAFTNFEVITEVVDCDINLLRYTIDQGWAQIPVFKNDTVFSVLPRVSINENGTVLVIHMAFTNKFILLASYYNEYFVYSPLKGLPGYSMVIALIAIFTTLLLTAKRKKNK